MHERIHIDAKQHSKKRMWTTRSAKTILWKTPVSRSVSPG